MAPTAAASVSDHSPSPRKRRTRRRYERAFKYQDISDDFQRFLQTESKTMDGMKKVEAKRIFSTEYRTYREQIMSGERLPSFYQLSRWLFWMDIAYFDDDLVRLGRFNGKRLKRNRVKSSGNVPGNVDSPSKSSSIQSPPKKSTSGVNPNAAASNKMAVDQHLHIKSGQNVTKLPDFTGDIDLWKHVKIGNEVTRHGKQVEVDRSVYFCMLCKCECTSLDDIQSHLAGRRHGLANSVRILKAKKNDLVHGIPEFVVSCSAATSDKDGTFSIQLKEMETKVFELKVTNNGADPVQILRCEMLRRCKVFTLNDNKKITDGLGTVTLKPGESYAIFVRAQVERVGYYRCPVIFNLLAHRNGKQDRGYVLRELCCKCVNDVTESLQPTAPYVKPPRSNRTRGQTSEIIPGIGLPKISGGSLEQDIKLDRYLVPADMRKLINRGLTDTGGLNEQQKHDMDKLKTDLEKGLKMENYRARFKSLLYFEEVQMEFDIQKYDMQKIHMKPYQQNKSLLLLKVPGLSENRPSVLRGDGLYVTPLDASGNADKKEYEGIVHEVHQDEVALCFAKSFRNAFVENKSFNVRFVFNRRATRLQHRACQLADELSLGPILFPDGKIWKEKTLPDLKLYDSKLEKNSQQLCAVQHIVAGTSKPAPYLVFGPPGTGKTVTIVEAIKQVLKVQPDSRILACTPSNSAADLIAKRLATHVSKADILRMNARCRNYSSIPEEIRGICNYDKETGQFHFPSKKTLAEYKILVTTLVTAGWLSSANFPPGHFTHIFIDEAGHAPEPEAVIAIAGIMEVNPLLKTGGQVVLSGDPKQLGPTIRSPLAKKYGLDTSLLERLMESCEKYRPSIRQDSHQSYDARVITKLLKNYRSHPVILNLPNRMFYFSELEACASIDREKLCKWEKLPTRNFPMLFHGVVGKDMREERSPSFFNPEEVSIVTKYVTELMNYRKGGINLKQTDIGVIAPYRKQVQKIKQVLRKNYDKVTVGSVEEFQGQERTVIIISTVRSNPEYLPLDMKFRLGFLRSPKRFNVSITRAKALLIVVGNPQTLSGDEHWKELIDYCEQNKSYVGTERIPDDDAMEDLIQRLNAVQLIDAQGALIPEIQSDYNDQAWRSDL